ncbi:hypothetical protein B0T11DRAFT_100155 [Plectosphaerella cucumerina]|uniref:Uncharacterized protein n=1 Tax=Plectosphaerella cucumerina TaxID=40658 RepID=A0A8K0T8A2_9PEZI|nr:hypothetical protein B0T11DRAFT_100155 [Plectosphaerella cucumerina]
MTRARPIAGIMFPSVVLPWLVLVATFQQGWQSCFPWPCLPRPRLNRYDTQMHAWARFVDVDRSAGIVDYLPRPWNPAVVDRELSGASAEKMWLKVHPCPREEQVGRVVRRTLVGDGGCPDDG